MYKHPLEYEKEDLDELMFKPLKIYVGPSSTDEIKETIDGQIIKCILASNPPHLPAEFDFQLDNGQRRTFKFFEVKKFGDQ